MAKLSKKEMISFLFGRWHTHGYDHCPICWNIKYHFNASEDGITSKIDGKPISLGRWKKSGSDEWHESLNNPAFNDKWDSYREDNWGDLFNWVSEDILSFAGDHPDWYFFEGFVDPDLDQLKGYEFHTFGRSGGWLILSQWEGVSLYRTTFTELGLGSWSWKDVHVLYKAVKKVDEWHKGLPHAVEYGFAFQRSRMEEEWAEEIAEAVSMYLMDVTGNIEAGDVPTVVAIQGELNESIESSWADMEDEWGDSAEEYVKAEFVRQANELMPEWVATITEQNCANEETFGAFAPI